MLLSTAEDITSFVQELQAESDRGLPLIAVALIDDLLRQTLLSFFCEGVFSENLLDGPNAPLGTLSARLGTCYSLGLIDEFENREINLLRKIRNEFAHAKHGKNFEDSRISGLCASLTSDLPEGENYDLTNPRFRVVNSAVIIVLRLYHRPDWVALERRTQKKWVSEDATRWRSFKSDPPPPGLSPVLAVGKRKKSEDD